MDQLKTYADDRLINGCIYCGGPAETRDHVPSRILLESLYSENYLPDIKGHIARKGPDLRRD